MLATEKACKICGNTEGLDVAPIVMPELLSKQLIVDALIVVCPRCSIDIRPTACGRPGGKYTVDELFAMNGTTYENVRTKLGIENNPQSDVVLALREIHGKNPPKRDPAPPQPQPTLPSPPVTPPDQGANPPPKKLK